MKNKIKAIIFDMDGVLIDAKDWHYEALNKALEIFGMTINRHEHLVTYDGLPTLKKLEILSTDKGLPIQLHKFINNLKQRYTNEIIYTKCKPNYLHEFALSRLKGQGFKLAVCSNSIRNTVEVMLDRADILKYFDFYLSNEDVNFAKPNPEIYIKAINILGLDPSECLILEDNENGIKAAKASGANLLIVNDVSDVNFDNISNCLNKFQS